MTVTRTWIALPLLCALPALAAVEPPPSLDELLGLEREQSSEAESIADQEAAESLRRRLAAEAIGDAFQQAIRLMVLVVDRLNSSFDTGIDTQRAQGDVIARLESLIEEARRQEQQGGACSSSSSSSSSPPSSPPSGAGSASGGDQAASTGTESEGGDGDEEGMPPPARAAELGGDLEETRSEWGALPDRERGMLLQGRRARFSSLYEQLTREYYRRLAEE